MLHGRWLGLVLYKAYTFLQPSDVQSPELDTNIVGMSLSLYTLLILVIASLVMYSNLKTIRKFQIDFKNQGNEL